MACLVQRVDFCDMIKYGVREGIGVHKERWGTSCLEQKEGLVFDTSVFIKTFQLKQHGFL